MDPLIVHVIWLTVSVSTETAAERYLPEMLPAPDSVAVTATADSVMADSLTSRLLYGGAGAVWAFVTSLIGLPPRPTSEVRDPLGDVTSFCAEYEATYGALHPPFHRSSYAQVRPGSGGRGRDRCV